MPSRPESVSCRAGSAYLKPLLRLVRRHWRELLSSMAAITVALVLVALVFGSGLLARQPVVHGQRLFHRARPSARRMFTGSDGSTTGTASFQGNFTSITQPQQSYFVIERESDCSLTLHTGKPSTPGSVTVTGNTPHYEGVLHKLASLTTKYDAYSKGCVEKNTGLSSRPVVHVGISSAGNYIFAAAKSLITGTVSNDYSTYSFTSNRAALPYASGIATADLNGDGVGDLVVVNSGFGVANAYVAVMLGNADGTFKAPVSYPTAGAASVAATIDDINGDGFADLIVASDDQHISVLLGKGDGTFSAATSFAAPLPGSTTPSNTPILALITADLRGIGKKDIVCSNGLVLLGKGDGTFTSLATPAFPFVRSPASGVPPGVASGDLNNDGKVDLVVGNGATIYAWLGKGDGTFTAGNAYTSIGNSGYVTVTDLDGDGNADIYTGLANGGFYSGDFSNAAAAYVLMGNGDGTFQGAPALSSGAYSGNNLADLNGDGVPDLISNTVSSSGGTSAAFTVALGNDKGTFTPVSTISAPDTFTINGYKFTGVSKAGANSYAVADVNGDDKADLVFVDNGLTAINSGSSIPITYPYPVYFVALGNGDGTFQAPVPHAFPQIAPAPGFDNTLTATGLQIGDFNRDSHADLIFTYNDIAGGTGVKPYLQGLVVLTGAGNGTFSTTPILTSTYSSTTAPTTALVPQIVTVADLNGDNNPDLIVNVPGTVIVNFQLQSQLQVYLSNGDGTFKAPTTIAIGANSYGIPVLADFNKDGKLDLAVLAETTAGQAELVVSLGSRI